MSDLKEETSVENAEQVQPEETVKERRKFNDPGIDRLMLIYEKNKKAVNYIGGGILAVTVVFLFLKLYYIPEQEKEAVNEMFWAQEFFEKDSFNLALNGGAIVMSPDGQKPMMGFEQVAENYNLTKSGNLANYYAGICYLRTGRYEQAIEKLTDYNITDEIIGPIALGAIGDCHMELNRTDEAVKYYMKAAEESSNSFTTPYFLKKAGFAFELSGNYQDALNQYQRLHREYPSSEQGREIEKDMARVKTLGNI